jgi:hypothetical protein
MLRISGPLSALVLVGLISTACGSSEGSEVDGPNGNGSGAAGPGGGPILGGTSSGPGGSGEVITPDMACATGTASATLSGVNMFVMFDRSSSMTEEANDRGDTRWDVTSAALSAFFASPEAGGLKLALRFFPHDQPAMGCHGNDDEGGCNVDACAAPLVDLGTLSDGPAPSDAHEAALVAATMSSSPGMAGQGTPISAALGGALQWAAAQRAKTPNENSVVVLVTDGEANGCVERIDQIAELAADALAANGVRTYAIGLTGSQERDMDEIAEAGGTGQGIFVADGANTQQELLAALGAIRGAILDCDFPMPEPKPGLEVNPAQINVNYTAGGGGKSTLRQVGDEAACTGAEGWYYDNAQNPTRILLCKSTCDAVVTDPMANLEILLGCDTLSGMPK